MDFPEALKYLLSLGNEVSAMKLGLDSVEKLLNRLGSPHSKYVKVQVAGTNGKGSVCAFLNSICIRAGIPVGMYTSPHLVSITERVRIDGAEITEADFARLATKVRETSESLVSMGELDVVPTFFEQVTAIALLAFAEAGVELVILETGLGGRLDATTAAKAEIAAITRIDLDHQKYLGETIEEIAAEKAAIIRSDSEVIAMRQTRKVEAVIGGRCREVGVEPHWSTDKIQIQLEPVIHPTLIASFTTERGHYGRIDLWDMLGHHQVENAALAIGIAELLQDKGFSIDREAIEIGLITARHEGRLEWLDRFLLDGAHNLGGARALSRFLRESGAASITMVFGAMEDKNVADIAAELFPLAKRLILTTPDTSRALSTDELLKVVPAGFDPDSVFLTANSSEAIAAADQVSGRDDLIVVTGSLYLVGEVRKMLTARSPERLKTRK
jgi:dihydrofolate synthase/folylpolyglutamate synthase